MSLKAFYPFILFFILASCRPETPADVVYQADSLFVAGMQAMHQQPQLCGENKNNPTSCKMEISTEGTVNEASSLLAIFLDELSSNEAGCTQMIYFGPYKSEISTDQFRFNDEGNYYINVQLIDTASWTRYMWQPEAPVKVKPEMKMHLLHNNSISTAQIEFEQ